MIDQGLSVRATEQLVRRWLQSSEQDPASKPAPAPWVEEVGRRLTRSLATRVAVRPRQKGGGRIVIDYDDAEQLDRLIEQLGRER